MKKKLAVVIIFIIVLVFPMVSWPIVSCFDVTLDENREKADFPTFADDVFSQFDEYFADRAPYRNMMIRLYNNSHLTFRKAYERILRLFNIRYYTAINDTLIGKDDWLFYTAYNSLDYYAGSNLPTQLQLRAFVERAEKVNEYFKSQGKQFVIFIAPNKEQIYSENMPESILVENEIKRVDVIVNYFKEHSDVKVIYPKSELIAAKSERDTYLMQDTHWNDFGAYVGAKSVLDALQIASDPNAKILQKPWTGGDLALLAAINYLTYTAYDVSYREEIKLNYLVATEDCHEYTLESSNTNGKNLLVLGDSFALGDNNRGGMREVLAKEFQHSVFNHRDNFTKTNTYADEFDAADVVIFSAAEKFETSVFESFGILQQFIKIFGL